MKHSFVLVFASTLAASFILGSSGAQADTDCTFTTGGTTMSLEADCTTDTTIYIPDGMMLDGRGYSITAVDPEGDHFRGGIVSNEGTTAHVTDLVVQTDGLSDVCDNGFDNRDRLSGIQLWGASGSITQTTVQNINQGPSSCREGFAIEIRKLPIDGTHPDTATVEIAGNIVEDYQGRGIICNGDLFCAIRHNFVGSSLTQDTRLASAIDVSWGAMGIIEFNHVSGNQHLDLRPTDPPAAFTVFAWMTDNVTIQHNNIGGNSDVGVSVGWVEDVLIDNNRIFDGGPDGPNGHGMDIGIWVMTPESLPLITVTNNKVRGFIDPSRIGETDQSLDGQILISGPLEPNPVCFGIDRDCVWDAAP